MSDNKYVCLIGAQKSGTTSLYHYLATHPQIHTIRWKEGKYFLNDVPPKADQQRYDRLMEGRNPEQYIFETSTYYSKFPQYDGVPRRIHESHPDAKFIYLVRDPIERIWSQYSHYLAKDWEQRPIAEAIRNNPEYLDYSRYYLQISQYLNLFPRAQFQVLIFEEFIQNPQQTLREIFEHLDIDTNFKPPNLDVQYNAGSVKRGMSFTKRLLFSLPGYQLLPWRVRHWTKTSLGDALPSKKIQFTDEIRQHLREQLSADLEKFIEFLGRDIPLWNVGKISAPSDKPLPSPEQSHTTTDNMISSDKSV